MADAQARLQGLTEDFNKMQKELQDSVQSRQKLEAQKQENETVKKEFDRLKDGETIYKLIGPVLLKQEKAEAESTVNGRLTFIGGEITRLEGQIKDAQDKMEKAKRDIIQIQATAGAQPVATS